MPFKENVKQCFKCPIKCVDMSGSCCDTATAELPDLSCWTLDTTWDDTGSDLDTILTTHSTNSIQSVHFSADGTVLLLTNFFDDIMQSWNLGTAWDPSSATTQRGADRSITNAMHTRFEESGDRVSYWDSGDDFNSLSLASSYTIAASGGTLTECDDTELGSNDSQDGPVCFSPDGNYVVAGVEVTNQWHLSITPCSTPFDLDTLGTPVTYDIEANLSVGFTGANSSIQIDSAGTGIYLQEDGTTLTRLTLGTAWDPTTATKDANQLTFSNSIAANSCVKVGDYLYVVQRITDIIIQRYTCA